MVIRFQIAKKVSCPVTDWQYSNTITKEVVENQSDAGSINGEQESCTSFDSDEISNTILPSGSCWGELEYRWQKREGNHCNDIQVKIKRSM